MCPALLTKISKDTLETISNFEKVSANSVQPFGQP